MKNYQNKNKNSLYEEEDTIEEFTQQTQRVSIGEYDEDEGKFLEEEEEEIEEFSSTDEEIKIERRRKYLEEQEAKRLEKENEISLEMLVHAKEEGLLILDYCCNF